MAASIRNSEEEIPAKKIKLTNEEGEEDSSDLHTFRGFRLIKVLNENAQAKTVAVHGERLTFPVCNLASVGLNFFQRTGQGVPAKKEMF